MNAYTCANCGRTSYSSAELANMTDKRCPYCGKEDGDGKDRGASGVSGDIKS